MAWRENEGRRVLERLGRLQARRVDRLARLQLRRERSAHLDDGNDSNSPSWLAELMVGRVACLGSTTVCTLSTVQR
jgi:hypothetical protein